MGDYIICVFFKLCIFIIEQVWGFSWQDCDKPNDPARLKTLNISPDPIPIPGQLTAYASGTTSVELASPLSVS